MYSPPYQQQKTSDQASSGESKLLLFIGDQKTTLFSPYLLERMVRVKTMHVQINKMTDRIRFVAQPNPFFRGERLVASALNLVSDRTQYAVALKDTALACFDNVRPLFEFTDQMAGAMNAIAGYQDVFLRQVQIFGVNPMKHFVNVITPRIAAEFEELEKRRDKFDIARNKRSLNFLQAQQELLEQAAILEASLDQVAEHQMQFAKCIDIFARGERQLFSETKAVIDAVKAPDYKKRWTPSS